MRFWVEKSNSRHNAGEETVSVLRCETEPENPVIVSNMKCRQYYRIVKNAAESAKAHYFAYGLRSADERYRFLVFKVRGHNVGRRLSRWNSWIDLKYSWTRGTIRKNNAPVFRGSPRGICS